jgi:hypothetical protein
MLSLLVMLPLLALTALVNPEVTQDTIHQTICVPGYATSVRPNVNYTRAMKRAKLKEAGIPATQAKQWVLDHIVALEVGGCAKCAANFQLQPVQGKDGGKAKDVIENRMHRAVCAGTMTLEAAQQCLSSNWKQCP